MNAKRKSKNEIAWEIFQRVFPTWQGTNMIIPMHGQRDIKIYARELLAIIKKKIK